LVPEITICEVRKQEDKVSEFQQNLFMTISLPTVDVDEARAESVTQIEEGQFSDVKAAAIAPSKLSQTISAFANTDGGELYIGIGEQLLGGGVKKREWAGFADIEAANAHMAVFERCFPLGRDFQYQFLKCRNHPGVVLHVQVSRTAGIMKATDGKAYIRRAAQNLVQDTPEKLRNLEFSKGVASFEGQPVNAPKQLIVESPITCDYLKHVIPNYEATPEAWLRKQLLIANDMPTVAGLLLFAEEPQAQIPKRCGIKIYRYKTSELEGFRDVLEFIPITIEGCLYEQIKKAVERTTEEIEKIPRLGQGLEQIKYPPEAIHEIITNAVIHRDYSIADDVHVRIFENRIEIQSPGRLPAQVTKDNILSERFARNGAVVRLLNKFPNPPNRDVGEGLNTVFEKMHQLGLKSPSIEERDSDVLVTIRHEPLASAEETIMKYLEQNEFIRNKKAREITFIKDGDQMKRILSSMASKHEIESVGKYGGVKYRKKAKQ
jgi:ATP-dependent DNA helicase RecG